MSRRRHRLPSSAQPGPALADDDILSEILLRLPPLPSFLPRASLVCKRWRRLVADPHFLCRFRGHHRKPPLLGFCNQWHWTRPEFTSVLDSPDTIPAARFSLRLDSIRSRISDCRHGRVLFLDTTLDYFLVWDPVTGRDRQVDFPPVFSMWSKDRKFVTNGAVVCAASEQGHVHGSCHSSETSWGNAVSLLWPQNISRVNDCPNTMSGNSIYWLLDGRSLGILKFDLCRQSLEVIVLPPDAVHLDAFFQQRFQFLITPADDGGLNFLYLFGFSAQVWKWKANCDGAAGSMLGSNFNLKNLLSLKSGVGTSFPKILGMLEDDSAMFLSTDVGEFMLHLESMQFKKLPMRMRHKDVTHYSFTSFYYTGTSNTSVMAC